MQWLKEKNKKNTMTYTLYIYDNFCVTKIEYIMYNVQDYSFIYKTTVRPVKYVRVGISLTCGKYLHDRISSLRGGVCAHKTSLTPPLFIEVS